MYAHNVIEDYTNATNMMLERQKTMFGQDVQVDGLFLQKINEASHYHFGDIAQIETVVKTDDLFTGEYGEDVRLPFKACWFDYNVAQAKAGFFLYEITQNLLHVELFVYMQNGKTWVPNPYEVYVGIGDQVHDIIEKGNHQFINRVEYRPLTKNIWITYSGDQGPNLISTETVEPTRDLPELTENLRYLNMCLLLLSCKNIGTEINKAPAKLNKKRALNKKGPLFEYRTLKLILPKKQSGGKKSGSETSERETRLHMCQGHFRTYTADAPLFGRLTGRFWIPAHVRGSESKGTITKNYEIKTIKTRG